MSNGTITKLDSTAVGLGAVVTQPTLDLLTAMGHGNGSGSTEEFVTMPGMSNTINAANYDGATNAAKVNAAIADAVVKGKTICFVPQSLLPYDASAVTFNTSVHMVREGGNLTLSEWDVDAYGARGAAYQGIQAAIDGATATITTTRRIVLPSAATYTTSKPLWVKGHGVTLAGISGAPFSGTGSAQIVPTFKYGPAIVAAGSTAAVSGLTASLVTGTGNAFQFSSSSPRWFNLRDLATCDLNGLSQLCVEMFVRIDDAPTASHGFLSSAGRFCSGDSANNAFTVQSRFDGLFQGNLTTSVGSSGFLAGGSATTMGTVYHVALTYDGSTVRLFGTTPGSASGVLASAALTGTILQDASEELLLGGSMVYGLEQDVSASNVTVDSVRISNVARYTASFTAPSQKFSADANTLVLCNFATSLGQCVSVESTSPDSASWLWQRRTGSSVAPASDFTVEDLAIGSTNGTNLGIVLSPGSQSFTTRRVHFQSYRNAVTVVSGDCYPWHIEDVWLSGGSHARFGLLMLGNAVFGVITNLMGNGTCAVPVVLQGDTTWRGGYILASSSAVFQLLCWDFANPNVPPEISGVSFSTEEGVGADWRANIAATTDANVRARGVILRQCTIEAHTSEALVSDSCDIVILDGCTINASGSPSTIINSLREPNLAASIRNCLQKNSFIPWGQPGHVVISKLGKLGAVTFSATPTFACDVRDEFEITLTGDCAPTITNVTPGQSILVTIIQDGAGAHTFTWPANVKGGGTVSATGGSVNQQRFTAMLDSATNPTLMADAAMVSV